MPRALPVCRLVAHVRAFLDAKNITLADMAKQTGISKSHLDALMCERKGSFAGLSKDKLRNISSFLGLSYINVCLLAGIVLPEDFYDAERFNEEMLAARDTMSRDDQWGVFVPEVPEWLVLPLRVRLGMVCLYQVATHQQLLTRAAMVHVVPGRAVAS